MSAQPTSPGPASPAAESPRYDVVVVGYGPTGMVLAALLGDLGHRVCVLERYSGLFNLPRAATFDDETMRLFQKLGLAERIWPDVRPQEIYDWVNSAGEVLIRNEFRDEGVSGWPEFSMMFQPKVEEALDERCRRTPGVEVRYSRLVTDVREEGDHVVVTTQPRDGDGPGEEVTASYVVGCDGGNSTVARLLGTQIDDYGFQEPWLVCDFAFDGEIDLPMAQQYGDPVQPISIISIGRRHHRFSFMLDEEVVDPSQVTPESVWARVARWITPQDAELIRVAPYVFRSTAARSWRSGRVLLAGDAAHRMPPFLGQGMCSGIRDAHNLAWKLDLVLRGAPDALLDTYEAERSPHVRVIIERAVELGKVQTIRDPEAARRRDERMLAQRAAGVRPAAFVFPGYDEGLLADGEDPWRGRLLPQATVTDAAGAPRRLDDVAGPGWTLVLRGDELVTAVDADTLDAWRRTGATVVVIGTGTGGEDETLRRVTDSGRYAEVFEPDGVVAVVVRPDRYVYGSATDAASASRLVADCLQAVAPAPAAV